MHTEIKTNTEALIHALALAIVSRTKDQYIRAVAEAEHFAQFHFKTEVEEAKKQAARLAQKWEAEKW